MECVAAPAKNSDEQIWQRLSTHWDVLKDVFKNWDTMSYNEKEWKFKPYVNLLRIACLCLTAHRIHKDRNYIDPNLEFLQKLLTLLEPNIIQGKQNLLKHQIGLVYAHKKVAMLLCQLDRICKGVGAIYLDAEFRYWAIEKLGNKDWEDFLESLEASEKDVLYRATAQGVEIEKQTITRENIWVQHPYELKSRLAVYHDELEAAKKTSQKHADCIGRGPRVCEHIKEIISQLKHDDDIEGREDGVQSGRSR
ncbi:hypothetical protein MKW92_019927 [Papaver armeniacum]|nr:hypothetical protein MKW92_019927 [Papaver armeniacum]